MRTSELPRSARNGNAKKTNPAEAGFVVIPVARIASFEIEERAELFRAARMAQLAQRLGLDLADALARDVELLADLFQRVVGVHVDAEAHAQNLRFARREAGEHG